VLVLLIAGLRIGRNTICARALREVAEQVEQNGYKVEFGSVQVSLVSGDIALHDLSMRPIVEPADDDSTAWYSASASRVELADVDIWALIREKRLLVHRVHVGTPRIERSFVQRKHKVPKAKKEGKEPQEPRSGLLRIDTLHIEEASGRLLDRVTDSTTMTVERLDILLTGIQVSIGDAGKAGIDLASARLDLHGLETQMRPFYAFRIDSMRVLLPLDTSVVFGVHMTTSVDPQDYHKEVEFQTELYELNIDTILLSGFDLAARLEAGVLRADRLYVAGAHFRVHRDKSIPLPPTLKRKPLLPERIKHLALPLSLGTVQLHRSSVTYHERLKRGEAYGSIAFTDISGLLSGLDNIDIRDNDALHLDGIARMGNSRLHLDLRMPMGTAITTLTARAELEDLPAREINRMTDELVHVGATAGRIHSVDMRMSGDDVRASGTLALHYEDLELQISPTMKHAGVLSFLANSVVRSSNMPGDKKYKVGRFSVKRRQQASVFNYIWLCLREGMMDVMLPPKVLDQLHKMQGS
jgi:hypothetical protein